MTVDNENKKFIIFKNNYYSLTATIKSEKNPAKLILNIHLNNNNNNNIIYLGELTYNETTCEWPEVNDDAVAILRNKNNAKDNEILFIYYVPNNTFIFGKQAQLKTMYKILFTENNKEEIKLFKGNDKTKIKIYDFKKLISI